MSRWWSIRETALPNNGREMSKHNIILLPDGIAYSLASQLQRGRGRASLLDQEKAKMLRASPKAQPRPAIPLESQEGFERTHRTSLLLTGSGYQYNVSPRGGNKEAALTRHLVEGDGHQAWTWRAWAGGETGTVWAWFMRKEPSYLTPLW